MRAGPAGATASEIIPSGYPCASPPWAFQAQAPAVNGSRASLGQAKPGDLCSQPACTAFWQLAATH